MYFHDGRIYPSRHTHAFHPSRHARARRPPTPTLPPPPPDPPSCCLGLTPQGLPEALSWLVHAMKEQQRLNRVSATRTRGRGNRQAPAPAPAPAPTPCDRARACAPRPPRLLAMDMEDTEGLLSQWLLIESEPGGLASCSETAGHGAPKPRTFRPLSWLGHYSQLTNRG